MFVVEERLYFSSSQWLQPKKELSQEAMDLYHQVGSQTQAFLIV